MQIFPAAPFSIAERILSVVVGLVMFAAPAGLLWAARIGGEIPEPLALGLAALIAGLLFYVTAASPKAYALDGEGLLVLRRAWPPRVISWSSLRGVRPLAFHEYKMSLRLWGSGGYLGYWGLMWCRALGRYWLYATHWGAEALLVEISGRPAVLTPAEPEKLIEALAARGVRILPEKNRVIPPSRSVL
jgi:hypothetical protein